MNRPDETVIIEYLMGNCSDETLETIAQWARESDENAAELFQLEQLHRQIVASKTDDRQVASAQQRLNDIIARRQHVDATPHHSRRNLWKAVAAAVALIVVGLVATWKLMPQNDSPQTIVAAAPANADMHITLSDGTKVWLNERSSLEYPQTFDGGQRLVKLTGEAYFEVAKKTSQPFIVESDLMEVKVLGTKFNFCNEANGVKATVNLIEGVVEVKGTHSEGAVELQPGQMAEVDRESGRLRVRQADALAASAWHDDMIPFSNANIQNIARTLESLYGMKVVIDSQFDTKRTYSGYIKRKDSIDTVLMLLRYTIPMDYTIEGNIIRLTPPKNQ